jgi:hypothetical protein
MKKLIVCGCSWMSPDRYGPKFIDTHFGQLIAKKLNYELTYFARPGSSNGGICVQLEEAIRQKPDLILFGQTVSDRVEIRISDEMFNIKEQTWVLENNPIKLSELVGDFEDNPTLLSDNLHSLLTGIIRIGKSKEWNQERNKALQDWFYYLYSPRMKKQVDSWCLYAVQHKLKESGIPAIKVIDLLNYDTPWYRCLTGEKYKPNNYMQGENTGTYHTTTEMQISISNEVQGELEKLGLI